MVKQNIAVEGLGTSGQVLTSNGAGVAPTWQAAGGGGGTGVGLFESTVGASGADYSTLGAAITAGKTRVLIIDDTTETGDITMPANLIVVGYGRESVNINMSTYKFLDNSGANDNFIFKNLKITYAYTSAGNLFSENLDGLHLEDVHIDSNSTATDCWALRYTTSHKVTILNCILDTPNLDDSGFFINSNSLCFLDGLVVNGGGSSNTDAVRLSGNCTNITFVGTFSTSGVAATFTGGSFSNIYSNSVIEINIGTVANATGFLLGNSGSEINILSNSHLSNFYCGKLTMSSASNSTVTGGESVNTSTAVAIGGTNNTIGNIKAISGFSITGDNNTLTGCRAGADAGGGSNTITVGAAADNTIIVGCRTDAAISDSGIGTTTAGNVVY